MRAVTIPHVLSAAGATSIGLLKLDIEGAERDLFGEGVESWLPQVWRSSWKGTTGWSLAAPKL